MKKARVKNPKWQVVVCPTCGGSGIVTEERSLGGPARAWCDRCENGLIRVDVNKVKIDPRQE